MGARDGPGIIWDVIIVGAGLIGLACALELQRRGYQVLLLERGEAGHEASWAGAGMLAAEQMAAHSPLRPLALASAGMYPDFCRGLTAETGLDVDYRSIGTEMPDGAVIADHCVDNRRLLTALRAAVDGRRIAVVEHTAVTRVLSGGPGLWRVQAANRKWVGRQVVNAAGAWAGQIAGLAAPVRPRKGQLLAVQGPPGLLPRVRVGEGVYLVPRSDGRIVIGATLEDQGFDKTVVAARMAELHARALALAPAMARLPVVEQWAGLRPGTADDLPLLGALAPGLWVATGHFRDGILLTPVTGRILAALVAGALPGFDLRAFDPRRFGATGLAG
ncbi:MAG: NAD(P)/FAD-dependent oxidoreductase [Terriglobales bacterium]